MEQHNDISESECAEKIQAMEDALYVIGGKWKLKVIIALSNGSKRFNEIQRKVTGITPRVLSGELKDLEVNGFLKRTVDVNATPIIVEYELTSYTHSLKEVVESLIKWGKMHRLTLKQGSK
jgi:DNA-binding HxlR family transcriptional regulator